MSDTELFFEEDISIDRELIAVVRANRFLYDKTEKLYANGDVKTEAWKQVGASLTNPIEGPAAEKRFYVLRQRFGKERRKMVQSMPRSGAGADQFTYKSMWPLYKDLIFLEDIIKPRNTSSNCKSKVVVNSEASVCRTTTSLPFTSAPSDGHMIVHTIYPFSSQSAAASSDMSSWNSDSLTNLIGTDKSFTDTSENSFLPLPTSSPSTSPSVRSDFGSNNTVVQAQKAISSINTKRKVPTLDSFANKKRQEVDTINKTLTEQSKGLTDLAAKIGKAITVPPPNVPPAIVSDAFSDIKPMLSAIGFALGVVPKNVQLECLIGILQYINDFSKNKSVSN
ncbi:uncharacterized protein LOC116853120 [Odontomachus brunneus]|uniref:uncharacterized protein LOC116853120 n=1 Tax=Odontomachus brunneus TaxID=486640 RepID=UPI0013F1E8F2|nr:uncharacterized protein LOC116853120 [Odontomachus brunneus]